MQSKSIFGNFQKVQKGKKKTSDWKINMRFDDNHAIHLEKVDKNYPHLDILRRINEEAFPKEERIDLSILFDSNNQFSTELHAVVDGEVPVGFAIWFDLGENYILWFYLAIDSQYQNCKYGTKTERLVFDEVLKDKIIFGGVEALDPNAENYKQRVSRIKFHTKNGFHIFDKVFDLGFMGKYQIVCSNPNASVDKLAELLYSVINLKK